jgi:Tryptophan synthase beta chain
VAHALKLAGQRPDEVVLVGLSGRGDKDVTQVQSLLGAGLAEEPRPQALFAAE